MNMTTDAIPNATIEAVARSLFRETAHYGFKQVDYLRFVNILLDLSMKNGYQNLEQSHTRIAYYPTEHSSLPLIGDRVRIRKFFKAEDESTLEQWLIASENQHFLICGMTSEKWDMKNLIADEKNVLGIVTSNNNEALAIGATAFIGYDAIQGKAELRAFIGVPAFEGRGMLKEATRLWIQFGISNLGLKKINLNILDTNIRTIKLNEELGFKVEGILRNECYFDGKYHDVLKMAYLVE